MKNIDWTKVLDAGYEKATALFEQDGTRPHKGKLAVWVVDDDGVPGQFLKVERPYIEKNPNSDTVLDSKFRYSLRTGKNSGAPEGELLEGEVKWKGAIWASGIGAKVLLGFTGLCEDDDVLVAGAMEAQLKAQL